MSGSPLQAKRPKITACLSRSPPSRQVPKDQDGIRVTGGSPTSDTERGCIGYGSRVPGQCPTQCLEGTVPESPRYGCDENVDELGQGSQARLSRCSQLTPGGSGSSSRSPLKSPDRDTLKPPINDVTGRSCTSPHGNSPFPRPELIRAYSVLPSHVAIGSFPTHDPVAVEFFPSARFN